MASKFYVPLGNLLDKTDNSIYKLVVLAAKRAQSIADGSPKLVEGLGELKPGTIALHEITQEKIKYKQGSKKD